MSLRLAADLYEDDFYAWTQLQAKELRRFARSRPSLPLDLGHRTTRPNTSPRAASGGGPCTAPAPRCIPS
jgi:hypothetical protein